ncbi:MAG TPA: hypothetical protein VGO36_06150 [Solirubrobacterales bacterium]|jgi:hypothetical protein|nr:hypothetical protein [Solirubrobacterales bacterium]
MPTRLAAPFAIAVLAAALLAGCGGSSSTDSTAGTTGPFEYETEPVPGSGPIGASAQSCETGAVDAESLRATAVSCDQARQLMYGWQRAGDACSPTAGAGRGGCTVRGYRCVSSATDRGTAVSCSRQGQSVAFLAVRR